MKHGITFGLSTISMALLAGCGGGGGGSSSSATLGGFTSFSAISPGSTITMTGMSNEASYTYDTVNDKVLSVGAISSGDDATVSITYDSNGNATSAQYISANGTTVGFNTANGDGFYSLGSLDAAVSANGENAILSADPDAYGWSYQTFGIWQTGGGTGSGQTGSSSVGATTNAANIPTTGTGSYTGYTGGQYVAANGNDYLTGSNLTATANFANRTLAVTSSGTQVTRDLQTVSNNSGLNFTGNLSYNAGSNQFTGNIATTGGMTGTMTGKFYGPNAEEIGGLFAAQGTGLEGYAGAFGAKR